MYCYYKAQSHSDKKIYIEKDKLIDQKAGLSQTKPFCFLFNSNWIMQSSHYSHIYISFLFFPPRCFDCANRFPVLAHDVEDRLERGWTEQTESAQNVHIERENRDWKQNTLGIRKHCTYKNFCTSKVTNFNLVSNRINLHKQATKLRNNRRWLFNEYICWENKTYQHILWFQVSVTYSSNSVHIC